MTSPRLSDFSGSQETKSTKTVIVYSAYNAAPVGLTEDNEAEDLWYAALRSDSRIGGLELPVFGGQLHPRGLARLSNLLDPGWCNTVSAMSVTLTATKTDHGYGLASEDPAGRERALSDIASARMETLRLQERLGRTSVRAFALQSAPRADRSSVSAFTDSLSQIASWDWGDIELLVEHSDALVPGQAPQKGYLTVEEEVVAVQSATYSGGPRIRHLVNWGRSAIEGRSATTPFEHVEKLGDRLGAFAFSGAAPVATERSAEWEDVHLGLASDEPGSLLDSDGARRLLAKLPNELSYIGVKTGAAVGSRGTERLHLGLSMLDTLC
ncbi:DUF4862 family protein [Arthrobacter sp. NPDC056493]|uniref:DUF4862 family protein n=1 Tax=Arthrobacter sp. NPDC056493 TaxID=3345839 RepID=UPI0036708FC4